LNEELKRKLPIKKAAVVWIDYVHYELAVPLFKFINVSTQNGGIQQMHVLLVGGNGFIGSHILDALHCANAQVSVLDSYPERYRAPFPDVRYYQGDYGDAEIVEVALEHKPDVVIHLANRGLSVGASGLPENDLRDLNDSVKLFESCVRHRVKKVIFMSTGGKIYGVIDHLPIDELQQTNPLGSYAITKLTIEKYLLSISYQFGIGAVIVRPSNPYGIRQSPLGIQGAIPIFAWRILHRRPITIWGAGDAVRDYIDVKDVASFCSMAATRECYGIFNLGSGVGVNTLELLDCLAETLQITPIIQREPARKFDVPAIVLDSTRAKQQFDWNPQTKLSTGLIEVCAWLRQLKPVS
jgi:UDP-glucose 4-epimerase